ncbi:MULTISPECIES: hypothetical protein [Pseudomonas]|uniref:hypothetical protein n=1 Tax=Pseudomonas TaxID=286 RepID=UPI000AAF3C72|nr:MULTISPECIES: hypothetical protein [Pseudomonas]MBO2892839.1 hypothetical protein [Pseudomonas asiatica]MCK2124745.1 hypothetical protein [Pseudomonas sp. PNPG3]QUN70399.1 hypothetical protein KDB76_14500 [Pseudomonas sp. JS425]
MKLWSNQLAVCEQALSWLNDNVNSPAFLRVAGKPGAGLSTCAKHIAEATAPNSLHIKPECLDPSAGFLDILHAALGLPVRGRRPLLPSHALNRLISLRKIQTIVIEDAHEFLHAQGSKKGDVPNAGLYLEAVNIISFETVTRRQPLREFDVPPAYIIHLRGCTEREDYIEMALSLDFDYSRLGATELELYRLLNELFALTHGEIGMTKKYLLEVCFGQGRRNNFSIER